MKILLSSAFQCLFEIKTGYIIKRLQLIRAIENKMFK